MYRQLAACHTHPPIPPFPSPYMQTTTSHTHVFFATFQWRTTGGVTGGVGSGVSIPFSSLFSNQILVQ